MNSNIEWGDKKASAVTHTLKATQKTNSVKKIRCLDVASACVYMCILYIEHADHAVNEKE